MIWQAPMPARFLTAAAILLLGHPGGIAEAESTGSQVGFRQDRGKVVVTVDSQPVATYVYVDAKIPRPYFAHVKTPGGEQVTRNHPPIPGLDRVDHDTMHPGIWLAFGDLDGTDFWRNKGRIVHDSFAQRPQGGQGRGSFTELKRYLRADGTLVCRETFRCSFHVLDRGFLLVWDSEFHSDGAFYFGDQEEMGLGVRVTTPISETQGGQLHDSEGRRSAKNIWSQAAAWCDYSGLVDGRRIGMTLMSHPDNFHESWMHARDYGFMAANPFGRNAMKKGTPSRIVVKPGNTLRLRYAIWIHSSQGEQESDDEAAYAAYCKLATGK